MCVKLCSSFEGCQSPKYDSIQLRCTVEFATVKGKSCGNVQSICTRYSRIIHARKKGWRRMTRTWKVSKHMEAETKVTSLDPRPTGHLTIYTTTTGNPLRLTTSKKKEGVTCPVELDVLEQNTTLHHACKDGKLCVVQFLLSQHPADINIPNKRGRTPVMLAALNGQVAVYDFLVGNGCDLYVKDDYSDTVLHHACAGGNTDIVSNLVVIQNCDVEIKTRYGWTPVMVSVFHGFINVVDLLVSKGCNVTTIDDNTNNILHVACMGGHVEMVKYMLSKGIHGIESKSKKGRTPLMIAAYYGHREVVRLLLRCGCNPSAVDDNSDNIIHLACKGGYVDVVKDILILNITNIESRGQYGGTPVIRAASNGQIAVVDFLVNEGCNIAAVDDYKNNILHAACLDGHVDMVKHILLHYKFDIDGRRQYGRTPVMLAAMYGEIEVVKLLVAKGCDFKKVDSEGDNLLHMACVGGHMDMVKHVLSMKTFSIDSQGEYGRTAAMEAAVAGHTEVVKYLGVKGSKLTAVDSHGSNILHLACSYGHIDIVKYILSQQMLRINCRGQFGRTPVLCAAVHGNMEIIKYLVLKECDFTLTDFEGNNILHLACFQGHVHVVKYILLILKVNIESRGQYRWTPVMLAAYGGKKGVFDFLVNQGSKLTEVDTYNNNILHLACMGGNAELVKYLFRLRYVERLQRARNNKGETPLKIAEHLHNARVVALFKSGM